MSKKRKYDKGYVLYVGSLALMNVTGHKSRSVFVRKNSCERKYEASKTERARHICPS
jgi:hypothetical protein